MSFHSNRPIRRIFVPVTLVAFLLVSLFLPFLSPGSVALAAPSPLLSPVLGVGSTSLSINANQHGVAVHQNLQLLNITPGSNQLSFTAGVSVTVPAGGDWLRVAATTGTINYGTAFNLDVIADPHGLAAGTYSGLIKLDNVTPGAINVPIIVPVVLIVLPAPTLGVSPAALTFQATVGSGTLLSKPLSVTNVAAGTGLLSFAVTATVQTPSGGNWLTASASTGNVGAGGNTVVNISANPAGLVAGTYQGKITLTNTVLGVLNDSVEVPVTLVIQSVVLPVLDVTPLHLEFEATVGATNPVSQVVSISNIVSGSGALNYSVSGMVSVPTGGTWLQIGSGGGSVLPGTSDLLNIGANISGLPVGIYTATVSIGNLTGGSSDPVRIVVINLQIRRSTASPLMAVTPSSLTFNTPVGVAPVSKPITISNITAGMVMMSYSITKSVSSPTGGNWLSVSSTGGSINFGSPDVINVTVNPLGLLDGTYSGTVTVTNTTMGTMDSPQTVNVSFVVGTGSSATVTGGFHSLPQFRLLDTRPAAGGTGAFATGETRSITAINTTGIPSNAASTVRVPTGAKALVANFTAFNVSKGGFLTAFETGITMPVISSLNWFATNQAASNTAIVNLNASGEFSIYIGASTAHVTVDVLGYIDDSVTGPVLPTSNPLYGIMSTDAQTYHSVSASLSSVRAYDSRTVYGGPGPLSTGTTRTVQLGGVAGIPGTAKAVAVNLTAVDAVNGGFLAAYPGNVNPGTASVLFNGAIQRNVGNTIIVTLDSVGAITVLCGGTNSQADFTIDVSGYFDSSDLSNGGYRLVTPTRLYDSRTVYGGTGPMATGDVRNYAASNKPGGGATGVPANATAVVLHLTATNTVSGGWMAGYGQTYQGTSSINWAGNNQNVSNLAIVPLNALDNIFIRAGGNSTTRSDFVIDIVGYVP